MINCFLIGHIGQDARVNDVSGKKVINFSVAHTEKYKDAQAVQHERTMWVECAWWRDNTNIAQYLKKGSQVYVEGMPAVTTYTNRDNKTMAQMRLRVKSVQLLGGNKQHDNSTNVTQQESNGVSSAFNDSDLVDDLPF